MATYKPLFMYVAPASIPQIVAHIQKYLEENPIISDPEAIAEAIQKYIEEHPEIIAVASVNGKTGSVVLTGSDININASTAVTVETQLLNLASMIASAGSDISQIQAQLETIYTNINTLDGKVAANETAIDNLETSVSGHGTRIAAAETDIDDLEAAQTALGTRINAAEGNISSLQTRMTQAETDIDNNESSIGTLNTNVSNINSKLSVSTISPSWAAGFNQESLQCCRYGNVVTVSGFLNRTTAQTEYSWTDTITGLPKEKVACHSQIYGSNLAVVVRVVDGKLQTNPRGANTGFSGYFGMTYICE